MSHNNDEVRINIIREHHHFDEINDEPATESTENHTLIVTLKSNFINRLVKHRFFAPLFYVISSLFIIFSLLMTFGTYILRLKVESAVVSSQIETMVAPANGYITSVFVTQGQRVKKGTPILKIENFDLEREFQLARIQVEEAKLNVAYYQNLLTNEQQRLKIYQKIGHNRVLSANTVVNVAKQAVLIAQQNLNRFTEL